MCVWCLQAPPPSHRGQQPPRALLRESHAAQARAAAAAAAATVVSVTHARGVESEKTHAGKSTPFVPRNNLVSRRVRVVRFYDVSYVRAYYNYRRWSLLFVLSSLNPSGSPIAQTRYTRLNDINTRAPMVKSKNHPSWTNYGRHRRSEWRQSNLLDHRYILPAPRVRLPFTHVCVHALFY